MVALTNRRRTDDGRRTGLNTREAPELAAMNIWLLEPYGPIPGESWRDYRFTMLGSELARRGHLVTWWTSNFSHHFKQFRSGTWQDREILPGFVIRLVPTRGYDKNIGLGRIRSEVTYATQMYRRGCEIPPPDLIVGTDPSQIVGFLSVRLAKRFNVPLILDVFDLWPELWILAFPRWLRFLAPAVLSPFYMLRRYNLRRADAITSLCDTYLALARRQAPCLPSIRSLTAFNGIDVAAFRAMLPDPGQVGVVASERGKQPGEVWAVYAGSLGNNYDIETLLDAAIRLQADASRVRIWVAGDGPLRPRITEVIAVARLTNLIYLGKLPPQELVRLYGVCDIGLCLYGPESNVAMPDKAYDYMAAGLPIINSLHGELEVLLREHAAGVQYLAGNSQSLADVTEQLAEDEPGRTVLAHNSFNLAIQFDRNRQYGRLADFVERVANEPTESG